MVNVRDVFDIQGSIDPIQKGLLERLISEEIAVNPNVQRMADGMLPYVQGRPSTSQFKMPLILASQAQSSRLPPISRALGQAMMGRNPVGDIQARMPAQVTKGLVRFVSDEGENYFEIFKKINDAKNPEAVVDKMILDDMERQLPRMRAGFGADGPASFILQPTAEDIPDDKDLTDLEKRIRGKDDPKTREGRVKIAKRRVKEAEKLLKKMPYEEKLQFVLPHMALNTDALEHAPEGYQGAMKRISRSKEGALRAVGMGGPGAMPDDILLMDMLVKKEMARRRFRVPTLDMSKMQFTMAHELDHVRDLINKNMGRIGDLPLDRTGMEQYMLMKGLEAGQPDDLKAYSMAMEYDADKAGFRGLKRLLGDAPKTPQEGIPRSIQRSISQIEGDALGSIYAGRRKAMLEVFGKNPPFRNFGLLGALGLIIAAASMAKEQSRGDSA